MKGYFAFLHRNEKLFQDGRCVGQSFIHFSCRSCITVFLTEHFMNLNDQHQHEKFFTLYYKIFMTLNLPVLLLDNHWQCRVFLQQRPSLLSLQVVAPNPSNFVLAKILHLLTDVKRRRPFLVSPKQTTNRFLPSPNSCFGSFRKWEKCRCALRDGTECVCFLSAGSRWSWQRTGPSSLGPRWGRRPTRRAWWPEQDIL